MTKSKPKEEYKESIGQDWRKTTRDNVWIEKDQYGYIIEIGQHYSLFHQDKFILKTNSKEAAKLISTILLNDKIIHQK